jgi:GAF domain-containing protein
VPDVRSETRWPGYTARVLETGAHAVVGVPMVAFGATIGVLNVYRPDPGPWAPAQVHAAEALAAIAAAVIAHSDQIHAQEELRRNLEAAIASHDVIGQAKGILMARYGMNAEDAFSLLRGMSQRSNRRLRDIAEHIVTQGDLVVDPERG